jgi:hypothetical protein
MFPHLRQRKTIGLEPSQNATPSQFSEGHFIGTDFRHKNLTKRTNGMEIERKRMKENSSLIILQ